MRPDPWLGLTDQQREQGRCSDDLCRTPTGDFFVRCVPELPLIGGPQPTFEFGVWASLSEANFKRYVDTFDDPDQSKLGWMFGFLSNEIRGFPGSFALKTIFPPQDDRQRPLLELEPTEHALSIAQRNGIDIAKALEIVHAADAASDV